MTVESSTIGEQIRWSRKPRKHTDPNPHIPSIIQSTRCKSTISSLLLSTFTNKEENNNKKTSFKKSSLRGFGCTAQPEVTVPGVIRSSAHWEDGKDNKNKNNNKKKKKKNKHHQQLLQDDSNSNGGLDLWCGPGIGAFGSSNLAADCVVVSARQPLSAGSRGKIDLLHKPSHQPHTHSHRERASYSSRQRVNTEHFASTDLDSAFEIPRIGLDVFEDQCYHHLRNRSPEELAEIVMFQNGLLMGRRSNGLDRYQDWRLDVDNMTYEELLELGERIGYVSTGLGEDQIGQCIRKTKLCVLDELSSEPHVPADVEGKCSICQEEYEEDDEMGKLECGHAYHLHCIEQWLVQKNACPVCKAEASTQ